METIYKVISIMRNNKKNWEIFSKGVKNIAIVCNHIPTTPALITTINNRENNMFNELFKGCIEIPQKQLLVKRFNEEYFDHNYQGTKFTTEDITITKDKLYLNMDNLKNNNFGYCGTTVYSFPLHPECLEPINHVFNKVAQ